MVNNIIIILILFALRSRLLSCVLMSLEMSSSKSTLLVMKKTNNDMEL